MYIENEKILYLAPFQGVTEFNFRITYAKHFPFINKIYTPFFTSINNINKLPKRKSKSLSLHSIGDIKIIPQILTKDAKELILFANHCKNLGFSEINWNLGCPYPRVANKERGSGLLANKLSIENILNHYFDINNNVNLTIKCRLGYNYNTELEDVMLIFNKFNIKEIIIHPRIGKQLYKGMINIDKYNKNVALSKNEIVYNGDIFSINDFASTEKLIQNKQKTWMIGRGVLINPFLPEQILKNDKNIYDKNLLEKYLNDLYYYYRVDYKNNIIVISILKELWSFLHKSFTEPNKVLKIITSTKNFNNYELAVKEVLNNYEWVIT